MIEYTSICKNNSKDKRKHNPLNHFEGVSLRNIAMTRKRNRSKHMVFHKQCNVSCEQSDDKKQNMEKNWKTLQDHHEHDREKSKKHVQHMSQKYRHRIGKQREDRENNKEQIEWKTKIAVKRVQDNMNPKRMNIEHHNSPQFPPFTIFCWEGSRWNRQSYTGINCTMQWIESCFQSAALVVGDIARVIIIHSCPRIIVRVLGR